MFRSLFALILLASLNSGVDLGMTASVVDFDDTALLNVSPIPALKQDSLEPDIKALSAMIMDYNTGLVLYEKNMHERLPMASLTKIMTAVLILENHDLDEIVTIKSDFSGLQGVRIWLRRGEQMTVGNLLKALLIPSAGDAAIALAEHHSGTVQDFVEEMNRRAKQMNLVDTYFKNPVGLDEDGHYSSAYDLAILSKHALHFSAFRNIVSQSGASIESADGRFSYSFDSTNYLLNSYLDILGVKTGTTDAAGESLINLARSEDGHQIIAVLLNSPRRFQENKSMIDWTFRSFNW